MYPFVRLIKENLKFRNAPLALLEGHISHHICWPWDLDVWMELNNGRTLTLFDLGRIPLSLRNGIIPAMMKNKWGITVAGATVRFRRRVRMFHRVEMHSRYLGWDHRFFYMEQSMWRKGEALNHILVRMAVTDSRGIVPPERLVAASVHAGTSSPELPAWVQDWIATDAKRPWPPQTEPEIHTVP